MIPEEPEALLPVLVPLLLYKAVTFTLTWVETRLLFDAAPDFLPDSKLLEVHVPPTPVP